MNTTTLPSNQYVLATGEMIYLIKQEFLWFTIHEKIEGNEEIYPRVYLAHLDQDLKNFLKICTNKEVYTFQDLEELARDEFEEKYGCEPTCNDNDAVETIKISLKEAKKELFGNDFSKTVNITQASMMLRLNDKQYILIPIQEVHDIFKKLVENRKKRLVDFTNKIVELTAQKSNICRVYTTLKRRTGKTCRG